MSAYGLLGCTLVMLKLPFCPWSSYQELPDSLLVIGGPMAGLASAEQVIWPCWDITAQLHRLRPVLKV